MDGGEQYSTKVKKDNRTSYKLESVYDVWDNNCCTVSGDGLEQIGSDGLVGDEHDPRELLKSLEKNYKKLGLTRTVYKKGGITITAYEPAKPSKKRSYDYVDEPIPLIKDDGND